MPSRKNSGRRVSGLAVVLIAWTGITEADVVLDGTVGGSGALGGPNFVIDTVDGKTVGSNLFHSFGEFNLTSSQSATFTNSTPALISNVLGRITDTSPSSIDGRIASTIPGANVFLMNPNGFLFGPNATLNVQGAFHATTADYIRLADGTRFNALPSGADALLTTAAPSAFGFLSEHPAPISLNGSILQVPADQTLSLISGDLQSGNGGIVNLLAPGGRINIASVASPGEVIPNASGEPADLHVDSFERLGAISLANTLTSTNGDGGGTVFIRGGHLMVVGSGVGANATGPVGSPFVGEPGAGIDVYVSGDMIVENGQFVTQVFPNVAIDIGGIKIRAGSLQMGGTGTFIGSGTAFESVSGRPGDIEVATNNLLIREGARLLVTKGGSADGADIVVNANSLELRDGGFVFSNAFAGAGRGGDITINADNVLVSNPNLSGGFTGITARPTGGTGRGGNVKLSADSLQVTGGGNTEISAVTFSAADAGDLKVDVTGELFMSGSADNPFGTGIFTNTIGGTGAAGDMTLTAGSLTLVDHARAQASTFGPGSAGNLTVNAGQLVLREGAVLGANAIFGTGAGGSLDVRATEIRISGIADSPDPFNVDFTGFSTATNAGPGGHMSVVADSIHVTDKGEITSVSIGAGAAGDIAIDLGAGPLHVTDGGVVISSAFGSGDGGNIDITAGEVTVSGTSQFNNLANAGISGVTSQAGGSGNAGNVRITANHLQVLDGATITTSTQGPGKGGNIEVNAKTVVVSDLNQELEQNLIAAGGDPEFARSAIRSGSGQSFSGSTAIGDGGDVRIQAGNLDLREHGLITSATQTSGAGGNVEVTASNISLSSNSAISANTSNDGAGGDIHLHATELGMLDGASVTAESAGAGDAGAVNVVAGNLTIRMGSHIDASTSNAGAGGDVNVTANAITLSGEGSDDFTGISAVAGPGATGAAGDINLVVGDSFQSFQGSVSASASESTGGNITITAANLVYLLDSSIETAVQGGTGSGGNITIDPQFVVLNKSQITANAFGGPGGNIRISAGNLVASSDSNITASSAQSIAGTIVVESPENDIAGSLSQLPQEIIDVSRLLPEHCGARQAAGQSSLVIRGRGGVAPDPDGYLPSFNLTALTTPKIAKATSSETVALKDIPLATVDCR